MLRCCHSDSLRAGWSENRILVEAGFYVNFQVGPVAYPTYKISTLSLPHTFSADFEIWLNLYFWLLSVPSQTCYGYELTFTARNCIIYIPLAYKFLINNNSHSYLSWYISQDCHISQHNFYGTVGSESSVTKDIKKSRRSDKKIESRHVLGGTTQPPVRKAVTPGKFRKRHISDTCH